MATSTCWKNSKLLLNASFLHRLSLVSCAYSSHASNVHKTKSGKVIPKVEIPKKIERSPTDLLEALGETVGHENEYIYKYIDDPLSPLVMKKNKQMALLSRASGRKAAKQMVKLHPKLFQKTLTNVQSTPPVLAWQPEENYTHTETSEHALNERIDRRDIMEAVNMLRDHIDVLSEETKRKMLDLVCFYHETDVTGTEPEEILCSDLSEKETFSNEAYDLFNSLEEKTPEVWNSYMRMKLKGSKHSKKDSTYSDFILAGIPIEKSTYQYLLQFGSKHATIRSAHNCQENHVKFVKKILKEMQSVGHHADLNTFHAALIGLRNDTPDGNIVQSMKCALALLNEMKALGIEPTMDTWSLFIQILDTKDLGGEKGQCSGISEVMDQVMREVESQVWKPHLQGQQAMNFLPTAMKIAFIHKNVDLADRIEEFRKQGQNYKLMTEFSRYDYSDFLFVLILTTKPSVEKIVKLFAENYEYMMPISGDVTRKFTDLLIETRAYSFIPQLLPGFQCLMSFNVYPQSFVLDFLSKEKQPRKVQAMAADLVTQVLDMTELSLINEFTGAKTSVPAPKLLQLMKIALDADQQSLAWRIFQLLCDHNKKLTGEISVPNPIEDLMTLYIQQDDLGKCAEILRFMAREFVPPDRAMYHGERVLAEIVMNDRERSQIERIMASSKYAKKIERLSIWERMGMSAKD